ncbi:MAG: hypothetical protein ACAI25_14030 [Planctomycetota bacterium]
MNAARTALAVLAAAVLAAPALAGEADLGDAENKVVRTLEKLARAEETFKDRKAKQQDGEPVYGTLPDLVAAKLAEESWQSVEGWTVAVTVSEELPGLLFLAIATPTAKDGRHFATTAGGAVFVSRKPFKADARATESFSLPPEKQSATRVVGKLTPAEEAARREKLAKTPAASLAEIEVLDAIDAIADAETAYEAGHDGPGTIEQLAAAKLLSGDVASGKAHGWTFKVGLTTAAGDERARFFVVATPAKPAADAHHFLRPTRGAVVWSDKPIEPDAASGAAPEGLETTEDMVAKTVDRLEAESGAARPCEFLALRALRAIAAAQGEHQERHLGPNEAATFGTLAELAALKLVEDKLASGERWGYVFAAAPSSKDAAAGWWATATPAKGDSGAKSFFTNHKKDERSAKEPIKADPATCEAK